MSGKFATTGAALLLAASCITGYAAPVTVSSGSSITIYMDGIGGDPVQLVPGLTSSLALSNFSFTNGTGSHTGQTLVSFSFVLSNTSSSPITASRISAFGFDTTPVIVQTTDNSISNTLFPDIVYGANFPNQSQNVEFCFTAQNCPGGGGTGLLIGQSTSGTISLYFADASMESLRIDEAYVRYQSISCAPGTANCPESATGSSGEVPEPSTYAMLGAGMVGLGLIARRRQVRK